jgi:hypothetical protein
MVAGKMFTKTVDTRNVFIHNTKHTNRRKKMSINALYKQIAKDYEKVLTTDSKKFFYTLAKLSFKDHKKEFNKRLKESRKYKNYTFGSFVKGRVSYEP